MDELVRRLRTCAELHGECALCSYQGNGCDTMPETPLFQAADAIEELIKREADMTHNMAALSLKVLRAEEKLPRWIPVTEQLPQEWWPVLGLIQYHDEKEPPSQQVLWYLGNGHWRETWRGDMIENGVTHWMPLPQPPKEKNDG